jgi:exonuclease SbcD
LLNQERTDEHRRALDWLLDTIREQAVDVLLVAGDIFDTGNPPNYARQLYFDFLVRLRGTGCRHVVITGGNHDSPAMLDAPRALLSHLNIHVRGAATEDPADELVVLRAADGTPEAIVAAVPFLRDRDLRYSQAGETSEDRRQKIQEGIREHYATLGRLVTAQEFPADRPRIAMGHLYAAGAVASAVQDNIYIGDRENIQAGEFPACFDYVALGHIHRAQSVGEAEHVRYSGSLIPLDFSETKDDKCVVLLEWQGAELKAVRPLPVPTFRRLKSIRGPREKVEAALRRFVVKARELTPWVDVVVETDRPLPHLPEALRTLVADHDVQLLAVRLDRQYDPGPTLADLPDLESTDVEEVFRRRCAGQGELPAAEWQELLADFRELREWMEENSAD